MLTDPGDRAPAPGPLRLIQLFVNTLDTENGIEELDSPAALRDLLARLELPGADGPVTEADLAAAIEVREALRSILLTNNGVELRARALDELSRAADAGRLSIRFDSPASAELTALAPGPAGALGRLAGIAYTAMADGSWKRLKACRRDVCHWIFYDRSRNGSSTWCAMSVCGNRTKTRAYRTRVKSSG